MHRLGLLVLALALAAASLFVALRRDPPGEVAETTPIHGDAPSVDVPPNVASTIATPAPEPDRVEPARAPASPSPDAPLTILGRCLGADGQPLGDAQLVVTGSRHGAVIARSGADGRFAMSVWPVDRVPLSLVASHRAHLALERQWPPPTAANSIDAGDLRLPPGCVVSGSVRESDGKPAAKLALRAVPAGEWTSEPRHASAQTGDDGAFTFDTALAPGRWLVRADPREFVVPVRFVVGSDATQRLDLQLAAAREPRRIGGTVVNRQGEPVPGVTVMALEPAGVQSAVSGAGGAFELLDWQGLGEAAAITLQPTDGGAPDPATRVEWGRGDVRLEWRRGTTLRVQVRWVGMPRQEQGHVNLLHLDPPKLPPLVPALAAARFQPETAPPRRAPLDAADQLEFHDLLPGAYVVFMAEASRYVSKPCQVQLGGTPRVDVTLDVAGVAQRELVVRWADGTPAEGAAVKWSTFAARPEHGLLNFIAPTLNGGLGATTDARGAVTLTAPAGVAGRLTIAARLGPALALEAVVLDAQPEPWIVTLPVGGEIEILGLPVAELMEGAVPVLVGADGGRWPEQLPHGMFLALAVAQHTGKLVRFAGVPAGTWRVEWLRRGQRRLLAEVRDLAVGEVRQVKVAVPELETATVQGQVRWNGRPHALGVMLRRLEGGVPASDQISSQLGRLTPSGIEHVASPGGQLQAAVPVGRYRAYIMHPLTYHHLPIAGEVEVRAGAVPLDLHLQTRPVRLRVLRAGLPWRGAKLRVGLATGEQLDCAPTDLYGVVELALPHGAHSCSLLGDATEPPLGSLGVSPGEGPLLVVFER